MKKKHLSMFRHLFAVTLVLTSMMPVEAQVSNPAEWPAFVSGSGNILVTDTFRSQSFLHQLTDNWEYTMNGGAAVPDGAKTVKIPLGGSVSFADFPIEKYEDVIIRFRFAGDFLLKNEDLLVHFFKGEMKTATVYTPTITSGKVGEKINYTPCEVKGASSLEVKVNPPASNTLNGFYLANSFVVYGTIPQYSLFTGSGNWNDTIRWSHLPPMRHRNAMINGSVTVNSTMQCNQALLGKGSLHIAKNAHFIVDKLVLYNVDKTLTSTDNSLTVEGQLSINEQLQVSYTFPEKGKWYFLSFPFDVWQEGIDNRFQLKDQTFSGSGNYIYVQVYDGDKRALTKQATGNWTVLSPSTLADAPVFEKGKGYLVALDADASDNVLAFTAASDAISEDFGKTASISVHASSVASTDKAHEGWFLCGNPLPSPLSLSQIPADPALDGNIYLYDGSAYKAYPIGSQYVLPPFSAFFVKASADTDIHLTASALPINGLRLKSDCALLSTTVEPGESAVHSSFLPEETPKSYVKGKIVYLTDLPAAGKMQVVNCAGRIVWKLPISSGSSSVALSLPPGFYIINIVTDSYHAQHKCVLTQ